jgi:hypothetical protein
MRLPRRPITICLAAFCAALAVAFAACAIGDAVKPSSAFAKDRRDRSVRWYQKPRAPLYNGSEPTISQISPAIRRARQPRFRFDQRSKRHHRGRHRSRSRRWSRQRKQRPSLSDALQQIPTPASETVLREAGVPIVTGVPSIVILEPRSEEDRERNRAILSQQQ